MRNRVTLPQMTVVNHVSGVVVKPFQANVYLLINPRMFHPVSLIAPHPLLQMRMMMMMAS
jgi:hypothetical protein